MSDNLRIKQIKTDASHIYDIEALHFGNYTPEQWESMLHGSIDTYVIPSSKSSVSSYKTIVEATENTISNVAKATLDGLVKVPGIYKLGDVILMEALGTETAPIFDRWISNVTGSGDTATYTLSVLETRVQTHTHNIPTQNTSSAYISVKSSTRSVAIPTVGTAVNVLTSAKGTFVTSINYSDNGKDGKVLTSDSGEGSLPHSHTVDSHQHSITFKPTSLVSQNISAVTAVTSKHYTPHTHTSTTVATAATNGTAFTFVTGVSQTDTFVKTLKQTSTNTGAASGNTGGSGELTTSTQASTDEVGSTLLTVGGGAHKHIVFASTNTSVVTAATVATSVVTSVSFSFTAPTVQANVVTSVTTVAKTATSSVRLTGTKTFMSTWTASVDASGILSFSNTTATVDISYDKVTISGISTITSGTQSAGSASLSAPRSAQSRTYGTPNISVTCTESGGHQHGFSHTHKIATHSHTLNSHTHTYDKATVSASAAAVINLTTNSHTPHSHSTVNVIKTSTDSTTPIKYIDDVTLTYVVRNLISDDKSFTTTSSAPGTNTVYTSLSGTITFPGLNAQTGSVATSTKSINPAVAGTTTALSDISFNTGTFITGFSTTKTGTNVGGN